MRSRQGTLLALELRRLLVVRQAAESQQFRHKPRAPTRGSNGTPCSFAVSPLWIASSETSLGSGGRLADCGRRHTGLGGALG
jgi:hypothetical protein